MNLTVVLGLLSVISACGGSSSTDPQPTQPPSTSGTPDATTAVPGSNGAGADELSDEDSQSGASCGDVAYSVGVAREAFATATGDLVLFTGDEDAEVLQPVQLSGCGGPLSVDFPVRVEDAVWLGESSGEAIFNGVGWGAWRSNPVDNPPVDFMRWDLVTGDQESLGDLGYSGSFDQTVLPSGLRFAGTSGQLGLSPFGDPDALVPDDRAEPGVRPAGSRLGDDLALVVADGGLQIVDTVTFDVLAAVPPSNGFDDARVLPTAVVAVSKDRLVVLDPVDLAPLWSVPVADVAPPSLRRVPVPGCFTSGDSRTCSENLWDSGLFEVGGVLIVGSDGTFAGLDMGDGSLLWTKQGRIELPGYDGGRTSPLQLVHSDYETWTIVEGSIDDSERVIFDVDTGEELSRFGRGASLCDPGVGVSRADEFLCASSDGVQTVDPATGVSTGVIVPPGGMDDCDYLIPRASHVVGICRDSPDFVIIQ